MIETISFAICNGTKSDQIEFKRTFKNQSELDEERRKLESKIRQEKRSSEYNIYFNYIQKE